MGSIGKKIRSDAMAESGVGCGFIVCSAFAAEQCSCAGSGGGLLAEEDFTQESSMVLFDNCEAKLGALAPGMQLTLNPKP